MSMAMSTIEQVGRAYRERLASPVEVTRECLARIRRLDDQLKALITVTDDEAMEAARRAERELARGIDRGPMHGIPVALKDLVDTAGIRTTAGSLVLRDNVPSEDAPVWAALREAGAVLVGKTNMQEFAYGVPHPAFGQTRNPWDLSRTAGGSSGGSAAAVMAGFCYAAVGTDTGGSIRVPASYCGAVGLKPTYGVVSTRGVFPLSWSLDHVGPIARTSRDAAAMFSAMTGEGTMPDVRADGLTLGVITDHAEGPELTEEARVSFNDACHRMEQAGVRLVPVAIGGLERADGLLPTIVGPEAAVAHETWLEERPDGYAPHTKQQLTSGFSVPGVAYVRAQRYRQRLAQQFAIALEGLDGLVSPTVPWTAPAEDPSIMSSQGEAEGRRTVPYNLIGFPALSLPVAPGADGLPLGLQIASQPNSDLRLLGIGHALESVGVASHLGTPATFA